MAVSSQKLQLATSKTLREDRLFRRRCSFSPPFKEGWG